MKPGDLSHSKQLLSYEPFFHLFFLKWLQIYLRSNLQQTDSKLSEYLSSCSWRRQPPFEADSIWMAKEKEAFTSPHTPRFILTTLTRSAISKINKLPALPDGSICFSNLATSHYINKTPPLPPCIKNSPCSTIINTQSIASYCFKQAVNLATKVSLGVQTQAK